MPGRRKRKELDPLRSLPQRILTVSGLFFGVWLGFRYLFPLFLPFLLGTGLALAAEPMVSFFSKKLRLPRSAAAGIGVSMTFGFLFLLLLLLGALIFRELGLLAGVLPDLSVAAKSGISSLSGWLQGLTRFAPGGIREYLSRTIGDFFSGGTALPDKAMRYALTFTGGVLSQVPDGALSLGTGIISSFMISAKLPKIKAWFSRRLPGEKLRPVLEGFRHVKSAVTGWLLAQVKLAGVTWAILSAGFLILRIPYAPLWALLVAAMDMLPVLGTGAVLLPWALICLLQGDHAQAIGLAGTYMVVALTRSALEPKLVGKQLGLDPLVTLFALYAGYRIWGLGGMLISPLLAVAATQFSGHASGGNSAEK